MKLKPIFLILAVSASGFLLGFYHSTVKTILFEREKLTYRRAVEKIFGRVVENIGEVRGLQPPSNIRLEIVDLRWVKGLPKSKQELESLKLEEEIYKALFLIPEEASLEEAESQLVFVAAASEDTIYLVREFFDPSNEREAKEVLAHEVTHTIQGKYFQAFNGRFHDEIQAWNALIEGDASFTGRLYAEKFDPPGEEPLSGEPPRPECELRGEIPRPVLEIRFFPYDYGAKFVEALYEEGGWTEVNEAYGRPPETTEQIMHPRKYLEAEGYEEVPAPPVKLLGLKAAKTERFGEHFILAMLGAHLDRGEALMAAEGWNGDNFTYYRVGDGYFYSWRISWDSAGDADEFLGAFTDMVEAMGGEREGRVWRVGVRFATILREGANSTLILGSSEGGLLLEALSQIIGDEANPIKGVEGSRWSTPGSQNFLSLPKP